MNVCLARAALCTAATTLMMCMAPAPAASQSPPDASDIVDRVLEAYGGADKLRRVEATRLEGRIDPVHQAGHGAIIRISEGADRLKQLIQYARRGEIRIVEGQEGWQGNSPRTLAAAEGAALGAMRLQAARADIPWVLDEVRDALRVGSTSDRTILLSWEVSDGLGLQVLVDPDSYRVLRSESVVRMGPMDIPFATDYSDFQTVDGVLYPFHEETYASGAHTASVQFVRALVNPSERQRRLPAR